MLYLHNCIINVHLRLKNCIKTGTSKEKVEILTKMSHPI